MPAAVDFRTRAFNADNVDASGKSIGRKVYWKLYASENLVRIIIHSVLSAQIGANWWDVAVDAGIKKQIERFKTSYKQQPWHSHPGAHDIYYTYLADMNEIIRSNSHLFLPVITDIDQWIARIEQ